MRIVSLNKNLEKYGFLSEMDYKNPDFHGHQTALCIGIKNSNGSWDKVYTLGDTEEEKIKIANNILSDKSLIILEDKITQIENDNLVPKIVYYLPYYVADHSVYQPTVNFQQISYASNVSNKVKIEVLFVSEDGWYNRYVVFDLKTIGNRSLSLMEFIEDLETEIEDKASKHNDFFIAAENGEDYLQDDIVLDFYDKSGQKHFIGAKIAKDFLDLVSSIRIIDIDTYENGGIDNEN